MELTTKTITLKATDYKENDKLVLLYSIEYGKILVSARGLRKQTAKLKFVAQPFSFCCVELNKSHGYYTLKTAEQTESFFELGDNIEAYFAACVVLDCIATLEEDQHPNATLFVDVLSALQSLCSEDANGFKTALYFLLKYLTNAGLAPNFSTCSVCGDKNPSKTFLDFQQNGTVCSQCRTPNSIAMPKITQTVLTAVSNSTFQKLKNLNIPNSQLKDCLEILNAYIAHNIAKVKSISELLKL